MLTFELQYEHSDTTDDAINGEFTFDDLIMTQGMPEWIVKWAHTANHADSLDSVHNGHVVSIRAIDYQQLESEWDTMHEDNTPDHEADRQTLAMAGWGTDEDYHFYPDREDY